MLIFSLHCFQFTLSLFIIKALIKDGYFTLNTKHIQKILQKKKRETISINYNKTFFLCVVSKLQQNHNNYT